MAQKLNYDVLKKSGYTGYIKESAPVKVLQFGEGNFLRAFVDYWFDMSNEKADWNGKVALVQPISQGLTGLINEQQGLYTLYLRGSENGQPVNNKRVISVVDACYNPYDAADWEKIRQIAVSDDLEYMASNTTEAGITYDPSCKMTDCPPASFPAKVTVLLYERFKAGKPGIVFLSCELIDANGQELKKDVLKHAKDWNLGDDFASYIENDCLFCSTLVDRIVPGRIRDPKEVEELTKENGYEDALLDVGEVFGVWYIEGPKALEDKLPFKKAGLNVHVVPEVAPYKKRKVRILNGAHTGFVLGAYLAGQDIVRDCMHNETIHAFMNKILYDEVIPILPLDKADCEHFAAAVTDRFNNPFVDHLLMSISLNSTSKWKARDLPSLLEYFEKFGKLPQALCMGFAAYIAFYSTDLQRREADALVAKRAKGNEYRIQDDAWVLDFYWAHKDADDKTLVHDVLSNEKMWDQDLTKIAGLEDTVYADLEKIRKDGAEAAYKSVL
ncbi:MAG: tagaturonate reductase [Lachnospiraceae bacterium]|jgi:tagaturonate reductase|nr:tagaturonate reductase [Lachnospiraceae bacterium]MCI1424940.1 tagaturonate reductase [Lachnospiraceae bacterium]MCI1453623.1 tagaturonate reductase [Lachnospiraceae bacterium]MDD5850187.1 tagaturonate reductase [Bacillota bacterium]